MNYSIIECIGKIPNDFNDVENYVLNKKSNKMHERYKKRKCWCKLCYESHQYTKNIQNKKRELAQSKKSYKSEFIYKYQ